VCVGEILSIMLMC